MAKVGGKTAVITKVQVFSDLKRNLKKIVARFPSLLTCVSSPSCLQDVPDRQAVVLLRHLHHLCAAVLRPRRDSHPAGDGSRTGQLEEARGPSPPHLTGHLHL